MRSSIAWVATTLARDKTFSKCSEWINLLLEHVVLTLKCLLELQQHTHTIRLLIFRAHYPSGYYFSFFPFFTNFFTSSTWYLPRSIPPKLCRFSQHVLTYNVWYITSVHKTKFIYRFACRCSWFPTLIVVACAKVRRLPCWPAVNLVLFKILFN